MLDIVFVEVKDFLLELQKNYLGSLEEKGRDVSVGLSGPKVLEDIWHFLVTQEIVLLVFFLFFCFLFSAQTYCEFKPLFFVLVFYFHSINPPLSAGGDISISPPLPLTFSPKF